MALGLISCSEPEKKKRKGGDDTIHVGVLCWRNELCSGCLDYAREDTKKFEGSWNGWCEKMALRRQTGRGRFLQNKFGGNVD